MDELNKAVEVAGGVGALASLLKVGQSAVSNWRARGSVSADFCPDIERATKGATTCEALRPDIRWHRIPDADWPHPEGRPLIDVATVEAAQAGG